MVDNINFKEIFKGKPLALTILMIMACSLLTGDSTIILPSLLFIGIFVGLMNKNTMNENLIRAFVAFITGSIIAFIISLISVYYTEGGLFAIALIQYSLVYIIIYTIIGCIGSALGYYVRNEIDNRG